LTAAAQQIEDLNSGETELVSIFRSLNKSGQELLLANARAFASNVDMQKEADGRQAIYHISISERGNRREKEMAITALIIMALVLPAAVAEEPVDLSLPGRHGMPRLFIQRITAWHIGNEDGYTYSSSTVLFENIRGRSNIRLNNP
jgi:hypothetical protein